MGLSRRFKICTGIFVTTGQTGIFVTTGQTGFFDSFKPTGFLALGLNPYAQKSGEVIISNSCYIAGETQFSYFVCCQSTEGCNYAGNLNCNIGCFQIDLFNNNCNQIWMVKNSLVGIGDHWSGGSGHQYSVDSIAIVNADFNNNYIINGPFNTTYTKTQDNFCVNFETGANGVIFKVYDSEDTKMKWTNKIEIIQSIAQDLSYEAGDEEQEGLPYEVIDGEDSNGDVLAAGVVYDETANPEGTSPSESFETSEDIFDAGSE